MGKQERHGFERGFNRAKIKHRKHTEQSNIARSQLQEYLGEPSMAFFPKNKDNEETVIYLADKIKERKEKSRRERQSVATAQDIANRIREQNERCVEYEHLVGHPAKLPIPWLRYRVKHWEEIQALKGNSITLSSSEASLSS